MEDGTVGRHCEFEGCNQKEYFSFQCPDCRKSFCAEHRHVSCGAVQNPDVSNVQMVEEVKR